MGRLSSGGSASPSSTANRPAAPPHAPGVDPWISHFSHRHHLELTSLDRSLIPPICAGCNSRVSGTAYSCKPCNYVLDDSCAKMPRRVRHPAHPHSVNIHAVTPGTKSPAANCAACGRASAGFVFKCDQCSYEMHCQCAAKPLSVKHRGHAHQLSLVFAPPYNDKEFTCDLCHGAGADHWLYRCAGCEFDTHIGCATSAAPILHAAPQPPAVASRPPAVQPQASPRPPAAVQENGPRWRPHARPQQASQRPPSTQLQSQQRPLGPRPLGPQPQYRPQAPGLLLQPRPLGLQQQPPQTNHGLGSGANQNDYNPTKADAAQGGDDTSDSSSSDNHSRQDGSDDEEAPNQMNNMAQQQGPRRQQRQGRRRPVRPQPQASPWRPVPQQPAGGILRPPRPLRQQQQQQPPLTNQWNQGPDSGADQKKDDMNDDERDGNCSNQQDGDDDQDRSNCTIKMELSVNQGGETDGSNDYQTGDGGDYEQQQQPPQTNRWNQGPDSGVDQKKDDMNDDGRDGNCSNHQDGDDDQDGSNCTIKMELSMNQGGGAGGSSNYQTGDGGDYAANEKVNCSFAGDGSNYGVDNSCEARAEYYEDYSFAGDGSNYEVGNSYEASAECYEDYSCAGDGSNYEVDISIEASVECCEDYSY